MKPSTVCVISLIFVIALAGCGSKSEQPTASQAPPATQAPATQPTGTPSQPAAVPSQSAATPSQPAVTPPAQPATTPTTPPAEAPRAATPPAPPPKPPEPKKYVVAAGTPISVRTVSDVSTKTSQSGNEFEATLMSPLVVDGHTLAKSGATVIGRVVSSDKGGRVKGKASLTLSLAKLHLANGSTVSIQSNSVSQEGKSDTKKNMVRTGVAAGAGSLIGAIAGGGKGAAIGAGVGAGAGVATNMATRGPAAEIPPETVLNFSLARDLVVTEKP